MKNFDYKNENGRSMIEMLGVLAIIGVLSVGGIAGYSKAMMKYKINKTIEQITLIAGNVRSFFAPQRNYGGLMCSNNSEANDSRCSIIRKAKLIPDEMLTLTNGKISAITNAFGGDVWISFNERGSGPLDSDGSDHNAFSITIEGIPEEACIELVSQDWSNAQVGAITIDSDGPNYTLKVPADVNDAIDKCAEIADFSGGNTKLMFNFDIDINSTYWQGFINP